MANWQGFYKLSWQERLQRTIENKNLTADQAALITQHYDMVGEQQVENYLYNFGVPTGLLLELPVDGRLVTVPMSTEEPSVIAAANNGARMMRAGAGVQTVIESRLVRGQIILDNVADVVALQTYVETHLTQLLQVANDAHPSMAKRGGGAKALTVEVLDAQTAIVNVLVDPKAAMGANVVNTMSEAIASVLRQAGYEVLMAILSNFATESLVKAKVAVPVTALATKQGMSGADVAAKIAAASRIETLSPYRAVTSNKGMLNGIEAAVLASGNDTRAVNAALHAYAAQGGQYHGLTRWTVQGDKLLGETTLPLILGVVGGSIGIVPAVKLNHALMDNPTVNELTSTIAAVGLAQNLAAIRALVSTGIQAGHMALQAKSLALQVGATPAEVPALTAALQQAGKFNEATARELLAKLR
ncbi:hydroxymethylglutaryl-CoA reductase, degradative [Weissella cibaria]|jgi:hydroxymethylglutaryl-CoA reductase|uniref:hydroxymethylglutaryl-CoA reductase, degradative n=1 Tax=Weissella cibaria TaxID=137591 RepID=UPI00106EDBAC|nr:hydroxymethylglutaryl-CoA reductase, degradative [Weissella cibaria]MBZ5942008.1 hydroxymethylglutaryl-CoA reductase, degradative [Weissella cibaria]MCB5826152.1 hydroxymethylglutaryl-CoA reductase, degradative [Weissella cibaria]MCB5857711.1 hydroxymethylglutaryl-CoA reductase, degradative [Weissella cibaria]MCB5859937.1 hydroxymethylglutaryl-CoA reductase, degradative [Weissella cibaria]MCB5862229.1 hydroxymethylglutaryl-CoA reductase, degradative [Weissella cibaria]